MDRSVIVRCENCLFWDRVQDMETMGLCRRNAPSARLFGSSRFENEDEEPKVEAVWPITWHGDGCGEGYERPEPVDREPDAQLKSLLIAMKGNA